ncbi:hypothetical protein [Amorphus sp. 3PC139-8]|uniref:hypothetical protein n=1 Tax=Amorphus sp. 3PC139-8 TaxID=2735676 RepID=UPI00345C7557
MYAFNPGDIVEIETSNGLAYVQVTHNHPSYPEVFRALPGLFQKRPDDFSLLAKREGVFVAMSPLRSAIERGSLSGEFCGNQPVPKSEQTFPTFKMAIRDKQGNVAYWWYWDGEGLRYEADADADNETLPAREIMSVKALVGRLAAAEMQSAD